jgi:hypothetical protein
MIIFSSCLAHLLLSNTCFGYIFGKTYIFAKIFSKPNTFARIFAPFFVPQVSHKFCWSRFLIKILSSCFIFANSFRENVFRENFCENTKTKLCVSTMKSKNHSTSIKT